MLKIYPLYFVAAFAFGILMVYLVTPPPEVVIKFPSPYNAGKIEYKDKSNACYKYRAESVECPNDAKIQPILEDFSMLARQANHPVL
jgi:hypothetical protein